MKFNLLPELLDRPLRNFPNLASNLFQNSWPTLFEEELFPSQFSTKGARVYEENGHLHVEVPLPGLNAKDIEVSLNKGVLMIKGEAKEEEKDKKKKYYHSSERKYSYSFALPTQIDEKQEPQATYTDGILNRLLA